MLEFSASMEELSSPGDPFVNLIYSLAVSNASRRPIGRKASNRALSEALVKSGLRGRLGRRVTRHQMADYAEGLLLYAWVEGWITLQECVILLSRGIKDSIDRGLELEDASVAAFTDLLRCVGEREEAAGHGGCRG